MIKPVKACLTCPLPDCDEKSPGCQLRAWFNRVQRMRKKGWRAACTTDEVTAYTQFLMVHKLEAAAQRSEGTRNV